MFVFVPLKTFSALDFRLPSALTPFYLVHIVFFIESKGNSIRHSFSQLPGSRRLHAKLRNTFLAKTTNIKLQVKKGLMLSSFSTEIVRTSL